jgi:hypothetical protein
MDFFPETDKNKQFFSKLESTIVAESRTAEKQDPKQSPTND